VGQPNRRVKLKEIQLKLFISQPTTEIGREGMIGRLKFWTMGWAARTGAHLAMSFWPVANHNRAAVAAATMRPSFGTPILLPFWLLGLELIYVRWLQNMAQKIFSSIASFSFSIFFFFFVFLQQQPAASCIFFSGLFTAQVAKANWVAIEGVARPECNAFCILNNVYGRKIFVDYCLTWSGSSSKAVAVAIGPQFSPINPSA